MKASLKGKCEYDTAKPGAASAATAASTFAVPAGADLKLRASMTDATFLNGPSLQGLTFTLEKPGSFLFDFNVPKQDFRFQFMNSVRVLEKPLNLTYIHNRNDNRTVLEGTLLFDPANKVTANHTLGSKNGKLKYTYVHQGITTFEPCYDLGKDAWDFAVSRRFQGSHVVRASYQTANQMLGLEWLTNSKSTGNLKISATLNLAEEVKVPKIMAESTFNFEM